MSRAQLIAAGLLVPAPAELEEASEPETETSRTTPRASRHRGRRKRGARGLRAFNAALAEGGFR